MRKLKKINRYQGKYYIKRRADKLVFGRINILRTKIHIFASPISWKDNIKCNII